MRKMLFGKRVNKKNAPPDRAGNVTSDGTFTNTWDYNNRLISSINAARNIRYTYDHNGSRVTYSNGIATTTTVSKNY